MSSTACQPTYSVWKNVKKFGAMMCATLMILFVLCVPAFSQNSQGAVFDQSGGAVANAAVSIVV
jgi:hypothetical protein